MREMEAPTHDSLEELGAFIDGIVSQEHDYGTCVYAMSLSATAAFNYVARKLGVTGFQASCADLDIIKRTRGMKSGFRILNYENLMYPQYLDDEHFPGWRVLLSDNRILLAKEAKKKLAEVDHTISTEVLDHWNRLASNATEEELAEVPA